MTNPISPRSHIKALGDTNGCNDEGAAKNARGIETTLTSFKSMGCFVNELLQNANDRALNQLEVTFTLTGSELVIHHNGKPFTTEDVTRICDYGNAAHNEKSDKVDQTGYKDIGFKSVFKVAYCVYIFSEEWRFHFDEKNPRWEIKPGDNPFPWQIAPLWTEDISHLSEIAQTLLKEHGRTTFVCRLNDSAVPEVKCALLQFKKHPENILFLNNTKRVSISLDAERFSIVNNDDTLLINDVVFKQWKRFSTQVTIPADVKQYLVGLKSFECPKRLQKPDFLKVDLSFCFPMNSGQFIQNHGIRFFCSLPVGVMGESPILVNAPFLLDLSREGLSDNTWNDFLIREIAIANFKYMRELFQQQPAAALRVLAPNVLIGISDRLRDVFKVQMEKCQQQAFLPPQQGTTLLKVAECRVDPSGFYKELYQAKLKLSGMKEFVHPDINPQELLKRFPKVKQQTTLEEIITSLHDLMTSNRSVDTCLLILRFFSQIFQKKKKFAPDHLELFKTQHFVMNTRKDLVPLAELHLPLAPKYSLNLPACLPLNVIHPDLINPELIMWLKQIGVMDLKPDKILNYFQGNLNDPMLQAKDTNIQIIRLLFNLFSQKEIKENDVRTLQGIPLLTKAGKVFPSTSIYLSGIFEPQFPLETHLPNVFDLFESADYRINEDDLGIWKKFFIALGVHEKCEMTFQHNMTVKSIKGIPGAYIEEYLAHVFSPQSKYRPLLTRLAGDDDDIYTFAYFPYLERIRYSDSFAKYFWNRFLASTNEILHRFATTVYHAKHKGDKKQPVTYLQYVFQHQKLIPDKGGVYHSSSELYAPSMEPVLRDYFPPAVLAVLPVTLSREMEQFLGFKMRIDVNDCHRLLGLLEKTEKYRLETYKLVLQHLLLNSRIPEEKEKIKEKKDWRFQATDNSWDTLDKLHYLSHTRSSLPIDSSGWIKPVLSEREMEEFYTLFGITPRQKKQDLQRLESAQASDELKEFILEKIPEIAFRWAHHGGNNKPPEDYIVFLLSAIVKLEFYVFAEEDENSEEFQSYIIDNGFYCDAEWEKNLESIASTLSEHLKFVGQEATLLSNAIKARKPRHIRNEKLFESFENAYQAKKKEVALALQDNILDEDSGSSEEIPVTKRSAVSPKGVRRSIENDLDGLVPEEGASAPFPRTPPAGTKNSTSKGLWTSKITPDKDSLDKKEPASKPALVVKSERGKGVSFANKTKSTSVTTPARSEIDNKKLGLDAEEHILFKHINNLKDKGFVLQEQEPALGVKRYVCEQKATTVDLLWHNSPELRPLEYKDDDLWDSGQHYDIQMTKRINGVVTKTRMIEVKGTGGDKIHFFLGALEWQTLVENRDNYRVYVVTNSGEENRAVTKIKDLIASLIARKYLPCRSIEFWG
jgi:hypothetical protein